MNPLYNTLGGQTAMNPMSAMMSRLEQFRQSFSGDPKQTVQQLLNSGRMTQAQYNQLSSAATQIQRMLGGR